MYQYNHNGRRWYHYNNKWYISVTEFVKNALPTPIHLQQWYKDNSAEHINSVLKETSEYGTQFHAYAEELLRTRYIEVTSDMDERMILHLAAINQFFVDWEVEPLSIEDRLRHDATDQYPMNFAGTVDLIAKTNKGLAIIDFKTGNIQDTHKYQMMCYYLAWAQANGEQDVTFVNVRPKDWRGSKPTYEAKVWSVDSEDWKKLSAMCTIYDFEEPKTRRIFKSFSLDQAPSWDEISAEDYINQNEVF